MRNCLISKGLLTVLIAGALFLTGCGGVNVKTDYYTLLPLAQTAPQTQPIGTLSGYTLALGPVTLPDFITANAQIMAAADPHKLEFLPNARWAEPLDTNVSLILTDNLNFLLKPDNILQYPWRANAVYDFKVEVAVFTLSANHDKTYLRGVFRVAGAKGTTLLREEINLTAPLAEFNAAGIVAAQNQLINDVSLLIAQKIFQLSGKASF